MIIIIKLIIKNKEYFIFIILIVLSLFTNAFSLTASCFSFIIFWLVYDKNEINPLINPDIIAEYKICGILYMKLNEPFSIYILCIDSSLKNKALTVKFKEKLKKNRYIFII